MTQLTRLNPEPLKDCPKKVNCTYPVCHCFDHDSNNAVQLERHRIGEMLSRIRIFIDDLGYILRSRHMYTSRAQLRVYRKRKIRLQKNFNFWKEKYDALK